MNSLRIFVSSPGDVRPEREAAMRVVARLRAECAGYVAVSGYFWEHEPMHAGSDFQQQIPLPDEFEVFVCILWSRLGSRLHRQHSQPGRKAYESGTEFEFEKALEAYHASARRTPRLMVYVRRETPSFPAEPEELRKERERQWDLLKSFLRLWTRDAQDGDTFKAATHDYAHTADFEEQLEEHLRRLMQELCGPPHPEWSEALPEPTWTSGSPYRGLAVFEYEHAPIFFGRTREIDQVVGQLRDRAATEHCPFVLIFGSSGSGKSSLLRAGILPLLAAGGVDGVDWSRRALLQPVQSGGDLFEGLAAALLEPAALPELKTRGREAAQLAAMLRENAAGVGLLIAGILPLLAEKDHEAELARLRQAAASRRQEERPADADHLERVMQDLRRPEPRLILGLDQLEEIFTHPDRFTEENRRAFIQAVASLVACGYVWVVATLRSDFFARCEELTELVRLKAGKGQYHLLPPTASALAQMVRLPAQAAGVRFEKDPERGRLDDLLSDGAAGDPGALPLLEFALHQLFLLGGAGRLLTHQAYDQVGGKAGLRGVLVQMAEETFAGLPEDAASCFESYCPRLATVGPELPLRFIRRTIRGPGPAAPEGERRLAAALLSARLLVADRDDAGVEILGVAHEALLNEWPRLREILEAQTGYLRRRARIALAAAEWDREGRAAQWLATGLRLAEAREVLGREGQNLSATEQSFIAQSIRRGRRRWVRTLAAAGVLVLVFATLALLALLAARAARARKLEAQALLVLSDVNRAREDFARDDAPSALVHLARAIEVAPERAATAAERLWFALGQRSWPIPLGPPLRQPAALVTASFSPDGSRVLTGAADGAAQLWDAAGGAPVGAPMRQIRGLYAAQFSPDGRRVLTAGFDGTGQLWDAATGEKVPGWVARHENSITAIAFSPDGRWIATGSRDAKVRVWEAQSGRLGAELPHEENVHLLAFNPREPAQLLTVSGRQARLWEAPTGRLLLTKEQPEEIHDACFRADGSRFLTACEDGQVCQWNTANGELAAPSLTHDQSVTPAIFSAAGERIATAVGNRVFLWTSAGERLLEQPLPHSQPVHCMQFHPGGSLLVTGSDDGRAQVWEVGTGRAVGEPVRMGSPVVAVAFSPDGHRLLTASTSGEARIWRTPAAPAGGPMLAAPLEALAMPPDRRSLAVAAGQDIWSWPDLDVGKAPSRLAHPAAVLSVALSSDGQWALSGCADGSAHLWDRSRKERKPAPLSLGSAVVAVSMSPDGTRCVTATERGRTQVWSVPGLQAIGPPQQQAERVSALAWSADGRRLAAASLDGTVQIRPLEAGAARLTLHGGAAMTSVAFSPSGGLLATGSRDGRAQLWNAADGQARGAPFQHAAAVTSVAFDATAARLVTASEDKTAVVWDLALGHSLGEAMRHDDFVVSASFSPDGRWIATASEDGTARLWDTVTGEALSDPFPHARGVRAALFSADSRRLFTASADGAVACHELPPVLAVRDRQALATLARALAPVALQSSGRVASREVESLEKLRRQMAERAEAGAETAAWILRLLDGP